MKTIQFFTILMATSLIFNACSTSEYAYDDVYYTPGNDKIKQVQKDPREDFNKTTDIKYDGKHTNPYTEQNTASYPQGIYQSRYAQQNQADIVPQQNYDANTVQYEEEYYDEDYAEDLRRLNAPVRSFSSLSPYQRDRILFTYDPFFYNPTFFYDPFIYDPFLPRTGLSLGWNSYTGWNTSISFGFGWGVNCGPSWRGGYPRYGNPYYNYYNPWNNWYGNNFYANNYWAGYSHGYNNAAGYHYYGNEPHYNNKRKISTPRGNRGSRSYTSSKGEGNPRGVRGNGSQLRETNTRTPGGRTAIRGVSKPESRSTEQTRPTPKRYATGRTTETYTKPKERKTTIVRDIKRPALDRSPRTEPRSTYTPPKQRGNTYNEPQKRVYQKPRQYSKPRQTQPRQVQPRQSRPSYNNSSVPRSYSPPVRSGGNRNTGGSRNTNTRRR